MTGPTVHPLRCPQTHKQIYGTVARALDFQARLEAETGRVYRPYRCEFCGWLHLTSHEKRHR